MRHGRKRGRTRGLHPGMTDAERRLCSTATLPMPGRMKAQDVMRPDIASMMKTMAHRTASTQTESADRVVDRTGGLQAEHQLAKINLYRPRTSVGEVYLKLTVIEDVLIVSFKEP